MHFVSAKTILNSNGMNLYRGCTHGCIYCDSRSLCYHTPIPFEDIEVKQNAPELLEDALSRKRNKCMIGTGSMCDPYMHCEKELCMTQKTLQLINRYGFGAALQTKSDMVLRDMEIIEEINKKTKFVLQMTVTTADDDLCRIIEPNVCPTSRRFEVLKIFREKGIPTIVWLSPILPFINDTEENLLSIIDRCVQVGVKGIICFGFGLTLRDGNREYFYSALDKHFPGIRERYQKSFGNSYVCESPKSARLMQVFQRECKKHKMLCTPDECFSYMKTFPEKDLQMELFS
ncbi:MAG: radical SAM protein [Treponema sp.]|nr:radical SAM protein [Treponema sp.]